MLERLRHGLSLDGEPLKPDEILATKKKLGCGSEEPFCVTDEARARFAEQAEAAERAAAAGLYAALGGAIGAIGAMIGGETLSANASFMGMKLGGQQLQIGPANSINLLFVLLNRALLFYSHTINWAHGRRDYDKAKDIAGPAPDQMGFTRNWSPGRIRICNAFFKALQQEGGADALQAESDLRHLLEEVLLEISQQ